MTLRPGSQIARVRPGFRFLTRSKPLGLIVALMLGGSVGWIATPRQPSPSYADQRLPIINAHLADAAPGYVLLAGDSHAELTNPALRLCGSELVNAGISRAGAAAYADTLARFRFASRPRGAVLIIGTNDLRKRLHPEDPARLDRFEAAVESIVLRLLEVTHRVVVTAVPPLDRQIRNLDAASVRHYSDRLKDLCGRLDCRFVDLFSDLREGVYGLVKPGTLGDGIHLGHYRPSLARVEPDLCRD